MKKYLFVLILLLFWIPQVLAQYKPKAQEVPKLQNGVFSTFNNFLNQKPVSGVTVKIKNYWKVADQRWFNANRVKFKSDLKLGSEVKYKFRSLSWGFSDGNKLYINAKNYTRVTHNRFSEVIYLGRRYSYFAGMRNITEKTGGFVGGLVGFSGTLDYYLIDMHNGHITRVKDNELDIFLSQYPGIYTAYREEKEQKKGKFTDTEKMKYIERLDQTFGN